MSPVPVSSPLWCCDQETASPSCYVLLYKVSRAPPPLLSFGPGSTPSRFRPGETPVPVSSHTVLVCFLLLSLQQNDWQRMKFILFPHRPRSWGA